MSDSAAPIDPAVQELATQISQLQQRVNALEPVVRFTAVREQLEDREFENTVRQLSNSVGRLRTRGYKFNRSLDETAAGLEEQWASLHPSLRQRLEMQAMMLGAELESVTSSMVQLTQFASDPLQARPLLAHAQAAVADLESRSKLAMSEINEPFTAFRAKVGEFMRCLQQLDWVLTQVDGAKFQLLANEAAVMATNATWIKSDQDRPEGILYLTDQRILFEQKQNIATKKFLFITTESKLVDQLLLDTSIEKIREVRASKKGFLNNEDHLEVAFGSGASVPEAHFQLHGQDSVAWEGLLGRAKTGNWV